MRSLSSSTQQVFLVSLIERKKANDDAKAARDVKMG